MSEKNFASYGDMETLVTEITSKINGKISKIESPTNRDIACVSSNGGVYDSGIKLKKQTVITIAKSNIKLTTNNFTIIEGIYSVAATSHGSSNNLHITSSDTAVATVSSEVTAEAGTDLLTITIYITPVGPGSCSIKILQDETTDYTGATEFINVNVERAYGEQTVTLSTSTETTVTLSDSCITANSLIDIAVSEWGLVPEDVTVSAGVCTVILPKVDSAHSVTVRIYVR